jgi:hypothetical protein
LQLVESRQDLAEMKADCQEAIPVVIQMVLPLGHYVGGADGDSVVPGFAHPVAGAALQLRPQLEVDWLSVSAGVLSPPIVKKDGLSSTRS